MNNSSEYIPPEIYRGCFKIVVLFNDQVESGVKTKGL